MVNFIHRLFNIKKMSPAQKIASSFLLVILVGTLLLMLPISNRSGEFLTPIDALFTATSATCVTGLTTITIVDQFNLFGQTVLIGLMQVGGLGLMTFMAVLILILKNRLSLHEKIAMKEMLNRDRTFNMKAFLLDILRYTLAFEAIGAILISIRLIPEFGVLKGIYKSIFFAVSAFCNAGFDNIGAVSLQDYVHDPLMMITIMSLIVLGGLGFAVWFDVRDKIGPLLKRKITFRKFGKSLSLHTKIVLFVTSLLIVGVAVMILLTELNNPKTMGGFSFPERVMASMFESIALRTAGFTSINYAHLNPGTQLIMMVTMFIGGSPGGTAGGIKTTTFAIVIIYLIHALKGREHTVIMHRTINKEVVIRAMGIFFINLIALFTGILLLCIFVDKPFNTLCFEAVSAMATVGSSLGITADLGVIGKLIIITLMFIGRIGISTLLISLFKPHSNVAGKNITYPDGNIIVG